VGPRDIPQSAWRIRKAGSLVKLLALTRGHRLHRDQLLEVLWPDLPPAAAANNLHQVLHFARRMLEPELATGQPSRYLRFERDLVTLAAPGPIWVDAEAFEAAAQAAAERRDLEGFETAARLYGGELLPADRYEDWAAGPRERLRQSYLEILLHLARLYAGGSEFARAVETLGAVLAIEPTHEGAHASLIRLYAAVGDRRGALRQYEQLRDLLKQELGVEPDSGTQVAEVAAWGETPAAAPSPQAN
jgi:DNA-binding SARP family transcriptional activator